MISPGNDNERPLEYESRKDKREENIRITVIKIRALMIIKQ